VLFVGIAVLAVMGGALLYIAVRAYLSPTLVEVAMEANTMQGVTLLGSEGLFRPDSDGVVHIRVVGTYADPSVTRLQLDIRPVLDAEWFPQTCCDVSAGTFSGAAQLGSPEFPVTSAETYEFRLTSTVTGLDVVTGTIKATPQPVVEVPPWLTIITTAAGALGTLVGGIRQVNAFRAALVTRRKAHT
jgi:hypothetical protein